MKNKDIQKLEKISKLLKEAFIDIHDIEDTDVIFNSEQAVKVIENHPLITSSLDELLYELGAYFEELASLDRKGEIENE